MDEANPPVAEQAGGDDATATAPAASGKSLDALVERWWADFFPGSAVAAYTQAWNVAFTAKEALKTLLRQAEGG
jgi:hypothetical protein